MATVEWNDKVVRQFSDYLKDYELGVVIDYTKKGGMNGGYDFYIRCAEGTDLEQLMEDFCNWHAVNRGKAFDT